MEIEREIRGYYDQGLEDARLTARPSLELLRTQALLKRFLPAAPARVLDVGGGSGVYASWLLGLGYDVELLDPVPLHVQQARGRGVPARAGDARHLVEADSSYDAVLLLGPLYHLSERSDRVRALAEAGRVARPGAPVISAGISRYASLFDGYYRNFVDRPGFTAAMRADLASGRHLNPTGAAERFTTAYFHTRDELLAELTDAGLAAATVLPVESLLAWAPGIAERLAEPEQRDLILGLIEQIENDPALAAATSHLLGVGRAA
jgi:SAM-dependent methyltransferase